MITAGYIPEKGDAALKSKITALTGTAEEISAAVPITTEDK